MTPEEFIARWRGNTRSERAAAQHHFLDLCDLLGVEKPGRHGYEFEVPTRRIGDTHQDDGFLAATNHRHGEEQPARPASRTTLCPNSASLA
jgi:hypothetical protein